MSPLLAALLGVLIIPLFVATWRTSLVGLGCQGLIMALIGYRLHPHPTSAHDWLTLIDLAIVRGCIVPAMLYTAMSARSTTARNDLIAPNLLSWTFALGIVLASFAFSERLVPVDGEHRTLVAIACAGLLLGLLVLAGQSGPFGQMIGALRIENTIVLLELGETHHPSTALHLGLLVVYIATAVLFRWYLTILDNADHDPRERSQSANKGPQP